MPRVRLFLRSVVACAALALPAAAFAHSFGRVLALPVPVWLYLFGAAAALLLSFVVLGVSTRAPGVQGAASDATRDAPHFGNAAAIRDATPVGDAARLADAAPGWGAWCCLALMGLAVFAALAGSLNPYRNFSMTWFWVVFLLGGLYASALVGHRVAALNPWRTLLLAGERMRPTAATALRRDGVAPALVLYMAWIAFELFGHGSPRSLGVALLAYTLLTLACAWVIGPRAWLHRGEVFATCFAVASQLAGRRRAPLTWSTSMLLFVLFMLSSTAFDGLKETVLWNMMYWQGIAPAITPWFGGNLARAYTSLSRVQDGLNLAVLLLSPLLYLGLCALAVAVARAMMPAQDRAARGVRDLLLALAPSLVPIAVAYNAAHYFTLLLGQGSRLPGLLLDPLGRGIAAQPQLPALTPLATWHVQVALILAGHVLGMAWCHRDLWLAQASRARNWLVQAPLLVLMVVLTASGLWVMSLPVNASRAL